MISNSLPNIEIEDVRFLTPAKITMNCDGVSKEDIVSIDLVSRRAYRDSKEVHYSEKIFEYLDRINSLPENFFEASEDIYDKAEEAKAEHDEIYQSKGEFDAEA